MFAVGIRDGGESIAINGIHATTSTLLAARSAAQCAAVNVVVVAVRVVLSSTLFSM
ncbi:MAG TPA: hypothetical protein ACQGQJ_05730 [Xylella fastidiosa subsp. multiplex]